MPLVKQDRKVLQQIAAYIGSLPPDLPYWQEAQAKLDPVVATNIQAAWKATGLALSAFFNQESNPIPKFDAPEPVKIFIQKRTSLYGVLASVMFEAEPFIKQEAIGLGLDFLKDRTPRDFVNLWASEDCRLDIWLYMQDFWESPSCKKSGDRLKDYKKIVDGDVSLEAVETKLAIWDEEDSKLCRPGESDLERLTPWQSFFLEIFGIYQKKISSLPALEALILDPMPKEIFPSKFAINNGELRRYPGRKSKTS